MAETVISTILGGVGIAIIIGLWRLAEKNSGAYHKLAMPISYFIRAIMVGAIGWEIGTFYAVSRLASFVAPENQRMVVEFAQSTLWTSIWVFLCGATMLAYLLFLSFLPSILNTKPNTDTAAKPDSPPKA